MLWLYEINEVFVFLHKILIKKRTSSSLTKDALRYEILRQRILVEQFLSFEVTGGTQEP